MTSIARDSRRRRILHEGSSTQVDGEGHEGEPASHARYTTHEGSASFAVAAAVLPRSPLSVLALVAGLGGVIALLAWAGQFGVALDATGSLAAAKQLLLVDKPGSLAVWWETLLWAAVATQAVLLFGLRKHRTDDLSGAYRWWLVVAAVGMGTSLVTATTAATAVASQFAAATGFSPLAADAFWWLVPGALVTLAVGGLCLLEVKESPLAAIAGVSAIACLAIGGAAGAGLVPQSLAAVWPGFVSPLVGPVAGMAGATLTLVGLMLYARRIVREAIGEVAPPQPSVKPAEQPAEEEQEPLAVQVEATPVPAPSEPIVAEPEEPAADELETDEPDLYETPAARRAKKRRERQAAKKQAAVEPVEETLWVSGPEADEDYDDGPQRRKLSKAERKRLRREKARRAA